MLSLRLTPTQKQMLYALGKFYEALNQPLVEKPVQLRTSKKTFVELLLLEKIFSKKERAIYFNLETLENKNCITYEQHLIKLSKNGLKELEKIEKEAQKLLALKVFFQKAESKAKLAKNLQTIINT